MRVLSRISHIAGVAALCCLIAVAQSAQKPPVTAVEDISGMYTFLKDGEFVQITVERDDKSNAAVLSGFISRYEEGDSDHFLDHLFSKASLDGDHVSFTTKQIHSVWFEFDGKVMRGKAKARAEEGYFVIKGKLTQNTTTDKKTASKSRELEMKSFPNVD
jgi:hypothetical protein